MTHSGPELGAVGGGAAPFRDDDAESVTRGIANDLKLARLSKELDLRDAAKTLRIQNVYLEALEDGRFDELPGSTYVAGFLRTYGDFLGLDGQDLVRRYKEETGGILVKRELVFPVPASEARQPTGAIVVATLVVAIAGAAGWYVLKERNAVDPDPASGELALAAPEESPDALDVAPLEIPMAADQSDEPAIADIDIAAFDAALSDAGDAAGVETASAAPDDTAGTGAAEAGVDPALAEENGADTAAIEPDAADAAVPSVAPAAAAGPEGFVGETADAVADETSEAVDAAHAPAVEPAAADTGVAPVGASDVAEPEIAAADTDVAVDGAAGDAATRVAAPNLPDVAEEVDPFAETEALLDTGDGYAPRIYGRTNTDFRVELRAVEETWIQVEDGDNVVLLTRVLLPGDIYRVPNRDDVSLDTGNAGGLEIRVDGEKVAPLGESGAVVRGVSLVAETLRFR